MNQIKQLICAALASALFVGCSVEEQKTDTRSSGKAPSGVLASNIDLSFSNEMALLDNPLEIGTVTAIVLGPNTCLDLIGHDAKTLAVDADNPNSYFYKVPAVACSTAELSLESVTFTVEGQTGAITKSTSRIVVGSIVVTKEATDNTNWRLVAHHFDETEADAALKRSKRKIGATVLQGEKDVCLSLSAYAHEDASTIDVLMEVDDDNALTTQSQSSIPPQPTISLQEIQEAGRSGNIFYWTIKIAETAPAGTYDYNVEVTNGEEGSGQISCKGVVTVTVTDEDESTSTSGN